MKKIVTGVIATTLLFSACLFAGCKEDDYLLEQMKTYDVSDEIYDMEIEIKSATVEIKKAEEFSVESNLKYLTVTDEDGCLRLKEGGDSGNRTGEGRVLIYVPDVTFGLVQMQTGAGKVNVAYLSAESLFWTLGAGETTINWLYVSEIAEITGGAGKLTVSNGTVHNLDMTMGVGECNFTGKLTGDNTISCGVGQLNLSLRGAKSSYCLEIATGLGGAKVDGESVEDGDMIGEGDHFVDIAGGVGGIAVNFIGDDETIDE